MLDCNNSKSTSSFEFILNLNDYISYKDSYCFLYLGGCPEYIFILNSLKQNFLDTFPEMSITICCKQAILNKLIEYDKNFIKPIETTDVKKFGKIEEIKCNLLQKKHPLQDIIDIISVKNFFKSSEQKNITSAKLSPQGVLPIKSLTMQQINFVKNFLTNKKNIRLIENDIEKPDWILGVENYETYYHASKGLKTTFINANLGKNIIEKLYENVEFLNI